MKKLLSPLYPVQGIFVNPEFLIVPGADAELVGVYALFRKRFRCVPGQKVMMDIACLGRYFFTLNNAVIGSGPARGSDFKLYYDTYDLTAELQAGENELVVELHYPGPSYRTVPESDPALWVRFSPEFEGSWEYAHDSRFDTVPTEFTFQLGRAENRDDRKNSFVFEPAVFRKSDRVELHPRPVPPREVIVRPFPKLLRCGFLPEASLENEDFARTLFVEPQLDDSTAFQNNTFAIPPEKMHGCFALFEYPHEFYGMFRMELEAPAGTIVDTAYDEMLEHGRVPAWYPHGKWKPRAKNASDAYRFADRQIVGQASELTVISGERGGRYLMVAVRNHTCPVTLKALEMTDLLLPVAESFFHCCDDFYNKLDAMCYDTVRHCIGDSMIDGPWREQAFWANDVGVVSRYLFTMNDDPAVVKYDLQLLLDGRQKTGWLPAVYPGGDLLHFLSIPALSVLVLYDCFMYSQDEEYVKAMIPVALDLMHDYDRFTDETGLVPEHPTWWNFIDLAYCNIAKPDKSGHTGVDDLKGHTAPLNALIAAAWRAIALIGGGAEAEAQAQRVCEAMKKQLWNPETRRLRDSDLHNHGFEMQSALPAAALLCFDLMPELKADLAAQLTDPKSLQPEPFGQRFTLEAEQKCGLYEFADKEIRRIWGPMVNSGMPNIWEIAQFGPRKAKEEAQKTGPSPDLMAGSCCHGFSCAPIWYTRRVLAGLRPTAPGFRRFECRPVCQGDFRCVQTTKFGPIVAERKNGVLTVSAPPECTWEK